MGAGSYDYTSSSTRAAARAASGMSAFVHDIAAKAGRVSKLHPDLDLTKKPRRESRDNVDNPYSVPIAVICDVTGSMSTIPEHVIKDMGTLMKGIIEQKVVEYPQILFGAVGDATCDQVPFQIGEFEADDELAEKCLSNLYLEGGGGGQNTESYESILWFFANQVDTDALDKRGEKGFLFIIGDEAPYPTVDGRLVSRYMGADTENAPLIDVARQCQQKWEVFCLRPNGSSCFNDPSVQRAWETILPAERVMRVQDWKEIVPFIAGTVSVMRGVSIDAVLSTAGFDAKTAASVKDALVPLENSIVPMATGTGDLVGSVGAGVRL